MEVEWSDRVYGDFKQVKHSADFVKRNQMRSSDVLMTTKIKSGEAVYEEVKLAFCPSSFYSYAVGKNITLAQSGNPAGLS